MRQSTTRSSSPGRWMAAALAAWAIAGCNTSFNASPCEAGLEECGGECVNTDEDERYCGGCGTSCTTGQVCDGGDCVSSPCISPLTDCYGDCVNLDNDSSHCGNCDTACETGMVCSGGDCAEGCESPYVDCYGTCADLGTDEAHCGNCDTACRDDQECLDSSCSCPGVTQECDSQCVDTSEDERYCGSCEMGCPETATCEGGMCQCPGGTALCGFPAPLCLPDTDGDGICDEEDACPEDPMNDSDYDGVCDSMDVCPGLSDPGSPAIQEGGFNTGMAWSAVNGATLDTAAAGFEDPGEAVLPGGYACEGASVGQPFCMPGTFETMGPWKMTFAGRTFTSGGMCFPFCDGLLAFSMNGFGRRAGYGLFGSDYVGTTSVCLGEGAYQGGIVDLVFFEWMEMSPCDPTAAQDIAFDNVTFEPDTTGECPAPGTVLNGDLAGGMSGWRAEASGIVEVIAASGDNQLHLRGQAATCNTPRAIGSISVPLNTSSGALALEFDAQGTSGATLAVNLNEALGFFYWSRTGTGAWQHYTFCLPREVEGVVLPLQFEIPVSGACATTFQRDFWIDDMVVTSVPASDC